MHEKSDGDGEMDWTALLTSAFYLARTPPQVNEFRHGKKHTGNMYSSQQNYQMQIEESQYAINFMAASSNGTKLIFADARRQIFMLNAVNDQVLPIVAPPGTSFLFTNKVSEEVQQIMMGQSSC